MIGATPNKINVATSVLHGIGAPVNQHTLGAMIGWFNAEGGNWSNSARFNPLNTTLNAPGAQSINGVGVKSYGSWGEGIDATVKTLLQPNMRGIVQAFRSSNPQGVIHAIGSSPWGTSGSLVAQTISSALGQHYATNVGGIARQMSAPQSAINESFTTTTQPALGTGDALAQAMFNESATPVSETGHIAVQNPLTDALTLIQNAGTVQTTQANYQLASKAVIDASSANVGGDAKRLLSMIHSVIGGAYNQGNHADISESAQQVRAQGTDCSGLISWLMGPHGLGIWQTSLATPDIAHAPGLMPGRGASITIWNNRQPGNAGHVFIQIGNQFFASEGGAGIRQISTAEAMNYIQHGSDGGTYQALHPRGL